jgi:hypothetical protein
VRYTYERNRFHQDILLEEAPPPPARFGLSDRSRLEVLTEWSADTIEPERTTRVLDGEPDPAVRATMVEPDLTDERLGFGQEMHFGAGTAFVAGLPIAAQDDSLARTAEDGSLAIAKRWVRIEGRPILIEAIEHRALAPLLSRRTYTLTALVLQEAAGGDALPTFDSKGQLRVAGVTREIAMPVEMRVDGPWLMFTAEVQLRLSDFGIEATAPTAGGGLIEIGDDVTVSVQWTVRRGHQGGDRDPF